MKRLAPLLPLLLAAGCGGSPTSPSDSTFPHLTYKGAAHLVTAQQVSFGEAEYETQKECVGWNGKADRSLPVEVFPSFFICGGGGGQGVMANGCTQSWGLQVNYQTFEPALSHELIHRLSMNNGGPPDYDHSGKIWKKCDRLNNPATISHGGSY